MIVLRPKTELQPDVLVFEQPSGRFKWEQVRRHLLAVEVMSRSTRVYDRDYKRPAYLALGVAEMWRVDCDEGIVHVSSAAGPPDQPHREAILWSPPGIDATFTLEVTRLLRGVER